MATEAQTQNPEKRPTKDAAPVYFASLSVAHFRCFGPEQTLNLTNSDGSLARWTIILGDNGVGKTTLLQCLAAMQPRLLPDNQTFLPAGILPPSIGRLYQTEKDWMADSNREGVHASITCDVASGRGLGEQTQGKSLHILSFGYGGDVRSGTGSRADLSSLYCGGYGASRRMGTTALSESADDFPCASLFSDSTELINAEEWLLQADYAARRVEGSAKVQAEARRDRIIEILVRLLPDVSSIRFVTSSQNVMQTSVQVETPYGWVPIRNLSLGYRALLAWMVDLASRLFHQYPESRNPLAEPAVVLVDEIDLHLHPRWQRSLMEYLTGIFTQTQFIATAHSPLVVQAAADANIVVLRREGDHVVIENDAAGVKNWRVDQVLTSDLFGLESARPPQLDAAMAERRRLLGKSRLTRIDKARLAALEYQIGELPTGETPQDLEAMDIIHRAAKLLREQQGHPA